MNHIWCTPLPFGAVVGPKARLASGIELPGVERPLGAGGQCMEPAEAEQIRSGPGIVKGLVSGATATDSPL